ncbi:hypothetical protein OAT16_05420 [Prolixibacteraceae bacterium]|nr:hypothetical protein [Prolixibacteraceae bacterium]
MKIDVNFNDVTDIKLGMSQLIQATTAILDAVTYHNPLINQSLPVVLNNGDNFSAQQLYNTLILRKTMECEGVSINQLDKLDNVYAIYTESYLVLIALEKGLNSEVERLLGLIINFSIKQNESDRMWCSDSHLYGLDILRIAVEFDEKYLYYLYQFVTPNWDEEHHDRISQYLYMDMEQINRPKLKALAYGCNSHALRCNFITYNEDHEEIPDGSLYDYFKQNPSEYAYFKVMLLQSLKASPRTTFFDLDIIIGKKYYTQRLNELFINNRSFRQEKEETLTRIECFLNSSPKSAFLFEPQDEKKEIEEYFSPDEETILGDYEGFQEEEDKETIAMNREFFLKGFANGKEMINYIETGKGADLLEKINPVKDLKAFAQNKQLTIVKRFIYDGVATEDFWDPFTYEQRTIREEEPNVKQRILRTIHILLRIQEEKIQYPTLQHLQKSGICSLEEFFCINHRFIDRKELVRNIHVIEFHSDEMRITDLEILYCLYNYDTPLYKQCIKHIQFRKELITHNNEAIKSFKDVTGNYLCLLAYLIDKMTLDHHCTEEDSIKSYLKHFDAVFEYMIKQAGADHQATIAQYLSKERTLEELDVFHMPDTQGILASILYIHPHLGVEMKARLMTLYQLFLEIDDAETLEITSKSFLTNKNIKEKGDRFLAFKQRWKSLGLHQNDIELLD